MAPFSLERVYNTDTIVLLSYLQNPGNKQLFEIILEFRKANLLLEKQVFLLDVVEFERWGRTVLAIGEKNLSSRMTDFGLLVRNLTVPEAQLLLCAKMSFQASSTGIESYVRSIFHIMEYYCRISNPEGLYDHYQNYYDNSKKIGIVSSFTPFDNSNTSNKSDTITSQPETTDRIDRIEKIDRVVIFFAVQLFNAKYNLPVEIDRINNILINESEQWESVIVEIFQQAVWKRNLDLLSRLSDLLSRYYDLNEVIAEISFLDENFNIMLENYLDIMHTIKILQPIL